VYLFADNETPTNIRKGHHETSRLYGMRAFHGSFQERTTTVMKPSACIVIAVVALALLGVYLFFSQQTRSRQ
jgi:hypothetical protein